ncbi:MAG: DUF438 domain-containing protein [Anaerolineaceae bacterium]|nr:DUF438 domain-containing protein [Anaerolineaceae bacterium]
MSEYINNVSKRKAALREVIKKLHQGQSVESLTAEFGEAIQNATSSEIAEAERDMIAEGIPVTDIQQLCDLHVAVFRSALENEPAVETLPGHPIYEFRKENEVIGVMLGSFRNLLDKANEGDHKAILSVKANLRNFKLVESHYDKKENLYFPYLENHGFEGPSSVMWGVDNEIRSMIKNFSVIVSKENLNIEHAEKVFKEMETAIRDMVYKEEKVLIPEAINRFSDKEWDVIRVENEQSFAESVYENKKEEPKMQADEELKEIAGRLPLSTGALTIEQINLLLTNLPVDVTFVDENDEVRFFSQTKERIFTRTAAIIGRKVQKCHPPQSVHVVEEIVNSFKAGTRDVAEFWIQMDSKFINIRYFALRDNEGVYKGTIEVSQDASHVRALEGERRLLDE